MLQHSKRKGVFLGKPKLIFQTCSNCGQKIVDEEVAVLVDRHNELMFCSDACVAEYFQTVVDEIEVELEKHRKSDDIPVTEFDKFENYLNLVLNEADEVWQVESKDDEPPVFYFIGEFLHEDEPLYYIAATYVSEEEPVFVYTHFPTRDPQLVARYRRGQLVYEANEELVSSVESLSEEHPAYALLEEMLENRSEADIETDEFASYEHLKASTCEHPEEIWRRIDSLGNTVLTYISHHQLGEETLAYVVIAFEDEIGEPAPVAFSFPTVDQQLLNRFRKDEIIFKAEEN
jgi:hypothetical protein